MPRHQLAVAAHGRQLVVVVARHHLRVDQAARVVAAGRLPRLGEQGQKTFAAHEGDVGDGHVPAGVARVAHEAGTGGVGAHADDGVGVAPAEDVHRLFHARPERGAALVRRLAGHAKAVALQRVAHALPAGAAVGVDLVEHGHLAPADRDEVIDQAGRLLAVRRAQVEDHFLVGRLPLRLGPGERTEEVRVAVVVALQQRQHARHRRRADVAEQHEGVVLLDEADGVVDGGDGVIAVVVGLQDDVVPADAAGAVDLGEAGQGAAVQLGAQAGRRPLERGRHAHDDVVSARRRHGQQQRTQGAGPEATMRHGRS